MTPLPPPPKYILHLNNIYFLEKNTYVEQTTHLPKYQYLNTTRGIILVKFTEGRIFIWASKGILLRFHRMVHLTKIQQCMKSLMFHKKAPSKGEIEEIMIENDCSDRTVGEGWRRVKKGEDLLSVTIRENSILLSNLKVLYDFMLEWKKHTVPIVGDEFRMDDTTQKVIDAIHKLFYDVDKDGRTKKTEKTPA